MGGRFCGISRILPVKGKKGVAGNCLELAAAQHHVFWGRWHITEISTIPKGSRQPGPERLDMVRHHQTRGSIPAAALYQLLPAATARSPQK